MRTRLTLLLAVLTVLGGLVLPAQAQSQNRSEEIRELLTERDRQLKDVLGQKESFTEEQRKRITELVNGIIDFRRMAQIALGPHWNDLTPEQRTNFVDVFSQIVRAQSLSDLGVYRSQVTYEDIEVEGDSAHVVTSTVYQDTPTKVEYIMEHEEDGWQAYDIILDDVSTAQGYARSFQTVIRKRGFDTLMTSLNKKLAKVNASS